MIELRQWRRDITIHTVIETDVYIRSADRAGMTEEERSATVDIVSAHPDGGDVIVGSGGCRKVRVAGRGKGKSGGYRVVTYYVGMRGVILLLAYSKADADNLTDAQVNVLARAVKTMSASFVQSSEGKMDDHTFNQLLESVHEAAAFMRGEHVPGLRVHIPAEIDIKAIRGRLGLSQEAFAERYGFPLATVRNWEQGRRTPDQAARTFLKVIAREPEAVQRALETT